MAFIPSPKQALLLWRLLFKGGKSALSDLRPAPTKDDLATLERADLIKVEVRSRGWRIVLNDENAWACLVDHLDAPVYKSSSAAPVLHEVFKRLKANLPRLDLALSDVFAEPAKTTAAATPAAPTMESSSMLPLEQRIRDAYLAESGGQLNRRVRLTQLRKHLEPAPRAEVDVTLLRLQNEGQLVLYPLDNPAERHAADDEAAVTIGGQKQHILYLVR